MRCWYAMVLLLLIFVGCTKKESAATTGPGTRSTQTATAEPTLAVYLPQDLQLVVEAEKLATLFTPSTK